MGTNPRPRVIYSSSHLRVLAVYKDPGPGEINVSEGGLSPPGKACCCASQGQSAGPLRTLRSTLWHLHGPNRSLPAPALTLPTLPKDNWESKKRKGKRT